MSVTKNAAALTIAHFVGYLIPLLEIPILGRALGPQAYGQVVLFQSLALLGSMIVEYGFNLSASRQVALARGNRAELARIFADVTAAKLLLTFAFFVVYFAAFLSIPSLAEFAKGELFMWSLVYFMAFGFSPFWYFQGQERMVAVIFIELAIRLVGLLLLLLFVVSSEDSAVALAILSSVGLLNTLIITAWCLSEIGDISMSAKGAVAQLLRGFHVFIYRSANNIFMSAAPSVVGVAGGPIAVSAFVPAEKVVRGLVGFSTPVLTALFPHFSRKFALAEAGGLRSAFIVVVSVGLFGLGCAAALWVVGPPLVYLVLGEQFVAAEKLLVWFVWLIPVRMMNQALGVVMLIPAGKERVASYMLSLFSIAAIGFGALLTYESGAIGMVVAFLVCETALLVVLLFAARKLLVAEVARGG